MQLPTPQPASNRTSFWDSNCKRKGAAKRSLYFIYILGYTVTLKTDIKSHILLVCYKM